jgi:hypothetical protein
VAYHREVGSGLQTTRRDAMDIGKERRTIRIEPIEEPEVETVPVPDPEPQRVPEDEPVR